MYPTGLENYDGLANAFYWLVKEYRYAVKAGDDARARLMVQIWAGHDPAQYDRAKTAIEAYEL